MYCTISPLCTFRLRFDDMYEFRYSMHVCSERFIVQIRFPILTALRTLIAYSSLYTISKDKPGRYDTPDESSRWSKA